MPPSGPTTTYTVRWRPSCKHLSESTAIASSSWLQVLVASWLQHNHHVAVHTGTLANGNQLLAGHALPQFRRPGASGLFSGGIKHLPPLLIGAPRLPFGRWNDQPAMESPHPHRSALRCRWPAHRVLFRQRLDQSEFGGSCGSLPKLDTSAIPCCASRNTAWIRSLYRRKAAIRHRSSDAWLNGMSTHRLGNVNFHPAFNSSLFTGTSSCSVSSRKRASVIVSELPAPRIPMA